MPLRARVGLHVSSGRQCQNHKDDQKIVIDLLNRIPLDKGGAGGAIPDRRVNGYATRALCDAILAFQKKHFPGKTTGFFEPTGDQIAKLEALGALPAPVAPAPAKPAGQWDALGTSTVRSSLRTGLLDDGKLSHTEVVNIVRSTLSDGVITKAEVDDLHTVWANARSLSQDSKDLLAYLTNAIRSTAFGKGPFRLTWDNQVMAADLVCDFLERIGHTFWPKLSRQAVGAGMLMRIANPGMMNQDQASLCGPAALLFGVAADRPTEYAHFGIDLFEKGQAKLGRLIIKPGKDVRDYTPPKSMDAVDWLTMASIRDSENAFLDYDDADRTFAGATTAGGLADWFRKAGYSDVRQNTSNIADEDLANLKQASDLYNDGYRTCLFIDAAMLQEHTQKKDTSFLDRHWVVLRSPVEVTSTTLRMKVYTWGSGDHWIPNGATPMTHDDFFVNYHGYVAGRP